MSFRHCFSSVFSVFCWGFFFTANHAVVAVVVALMVAVAVSVGITRWSSILSKVSFKLFQAKRRVFFSVVGFCFTFVAFLRFSWSFVCFFCFWFFCQFLSSPNEKDSSERSGLNSSQRQSTYLAIRWSNSALISGEKEVKWGKIWLKKEWHHLGKSRKYL